MSGTFVEGCPNLRWWLETGFNRVYTPYTVSVRRFRRRVKRSSVKSDICFIDLYRVRSVITLSTVRFPIRESQLNTFRRLLINDPRSTRTYTYLYRPPIKTTTSPYKKVFPYQILFLFIMITSGTPLSKRQVNEKWTTKRYERCYTKWVRIVKSHGRVL